MIRARDSQRLPRNRNAVPREFIAEHDVPRAATPIFQHVVDTYASEANKVGAVWSELGDDQLDFRLHVRSSSICQIMAHQIRSEHRFFAEFIGLKEPAAAALLPPGDPLRPARTSNDSSHWRARGSHRWRLETRHSGWRRFRSSTCGGSASGVFWRRVLHTAHHRAQVGVCLRLLNARVPPTYGPTADVTWAGADPTLAAQTPPS